MGENFLLHILRTGKDVAMKFFKSIDNAVPHRLTKIYLVQPEVLVGKRKQKTAEL